MHVISSAINLIDSLQANYPQDLAEDLTKRLIKSIISQDPQKFQRKIGQIKKKEKQHGKQ